MLKDIFLPLLMFPILSAIAFNFTLVNISKSGISITIEEHCYSSLTSPDKIPYRLAYTGLSGFDVQLCRFVTVFHAAMVPGAPLTFTSYFLCLLFPIVAILSVEACRKGRSISIAAPAIYGVVYQIYDLGVTIPFYWLAFILTGNTKRSRYRGPEGGTVSQGNAEAIVFGLVVGSIIPTFGMLYLNDPYVTAIWQAFPIYVSVAQFAHTLLRRSSHNNSSGHGVIQMLYIALFVLSSSIHIATIWPIVTDVQALKILFLPSVSPLYRPSLTDQMHDFLKWDFTLGFASSILATLWSASSLKQLLTLVLWHISSVPLFGPGAALMGHALWRESVLSEGKPGVR